MTDLFVDLDHLTSLSGRLGAAAARMSEGAVDRVGALGVERIDSALTAFRERRRHGLDRLASDVGRAAEGLVRTRDAYAAAETAIERGFAP